MNITSEKLFSLSVSGLGNNNYCPIQAGCEVDFLSWYRIRRFGELKITIKYFNRIFSTGCGVREEKGPAFTVVSAYIGHDEKPSAEAKNEVRLSFGGKPETTVVDGYESDPAEVSVPEGEWLSVRLRVRADADCALLSTDESCTGGYRDGAFSLNVLRPNFIGCEGDFRETLLFFGDSITQGSQTRPDEYEAWSHRIAMAVPADISVINNGVGWSRAYDAAADGIFLKLARRGTTVTICFGVNDIKSAGRTGAEVIADLRRTIELLKKDKPELKVILFTVPPFNLDPWGEEQRQIVNREILSGGLCERVFDFASVLEDSEAGRVRPEYMCGPDDAHPNGMAGEAAAKALLAGGLLEAGGGI